MAREITLEHPCVTFLTHLSNHMQSDSASFATSIRIKKLKHFVLTDLGFSDIFTNYDQIGEDFLRQIKNLIYTTHKKKKNLLNWFSHIVPGVERWEKDHLLFTAASFGNKKKNPDAITLH